MLLVLLLLVETSCDCEDYTNPTTHIESVNLLGGVSGCVSVNSGFFEGLSAWEGGAITVKQRLSLTITDCSFISCTAVRDGIWLAYAGACDIGATNQTMLRCCGTSCKSDDYGHFVFIVGFGEDSSVPMEFRTFSEISVLSCGDSGTGSVYLETPIGAQFFQINVTSCKSSLGGGAFCSSWISASASYRFRYLNVVSCSNSLSIILNWRPSLPEIEYTNFYDNKPTLLIGILLKGNGMKIRNGVFRGNTRTFVSSDADPAFDFDFCYFSPSAPESGGTTGSNCAVTVAASFWIFAINTAACPGIPTLSASPPPTLTPSVSKSPTAIYSSTFAATDHFTSSRALLGSTPFGPTVAFSGSAAPAADGWVSVGAIAGMAVGAAVLVSLIVGLLRLIRRRSEVVEYYSDSEMGEEPPSLQLTNNFSHEFASPLTVVDQSVLDPDGLWIGVHSPDEGI
jgi:hypothetical protein